MSEAAKPAPDVSAVHWLSGEISTFLNKLVLPALWLTLLLGMLVLLIATIGRVEIAGWFRTIVALFFIATLPLSYLTAHLQRVGYRGRDLVVANYWRRGIIPFHDVEAVEPVWWYRGRLVRIKFRSRTPFGTLVYYMPKWGPALALVSSPEKDLQRVIWPERA